MDIHTRVAAALSILEGLIGVLFMGLMALALGSLPHFMPSIPLPQAMRAFGAIMLALMAALGLAQAIAGLALLKGSQTGRGFTIAFAILGLFNKPWGTLAGIYILWALLRKRPATPAEAG